MANFFDTGTDIQPNLTPLNKNFFDTEIPQLEQKKKVGYLEDILKSIPTGMKKGLANFSEALQPAAEAEARMAAPDIGVGQPGQAEKIIERTIPATTYKPQTVPGEYGQKFGEFIPYMAIPGGGIGKAATVPQMLTGVAGKVAKEALIPSMGAETGRQLSLSEGQPTSATPYAEFLGGMLTPSVRGIAAGKPTEEHLANVKYLQSHGIEPTAGDQAGLGFARWVEQNAPDMPMLGGLGQRINQQRDTQFTQELMRRAGADRIEKGALQGERATAENLGKLHEDISKDYESLYRRNDLKFDTDLAQGQVAAISKYENSTGRPAPKLASEISGRINDLWDQGAMNGREYGAKRSELLRAADRAEVSHDHDRAQLFRDVAYNMQAGFGRSVSPEDMALWQSANQRWGNLENLKKSVHGPGQQTAEGLASPERYRTAVEKWEGPGYAFGQSENEKLARASTVLNRLPQSGTGPRTTATIMGSMLGMAGLGGLLGHPVAGGLASGAMIGPSLMGGAMLHRPGQALMKPLGQPTAAYLAPYYARALLGAQGQ